MKRAVTSYTTKRSKLNILSIRSEEDEEMIYGKDLSHFEIICSLGKGSSGRVFKVKCIMSGKIRVMKQIYISSREKFKHTQGIIEAKFMKRIKHKNFVKYYTSFYENSYFNIVMEYAEGGDLQNMIKTSREKREKIPEKTIISLISQILDALHYLHSKNIIHRDIKAHNIFLTLDQVIKIGDLGFCCAYKKVQKEEIIRRVGTPLYLSPEMVKLRPYDFKVDIWAFGCLLYNLIYLEPPFRGETMLSLGFNIVNKPPKAIKSDLYSESIKKIIASCLEKEPMERPSAQELREMLSQNSVMKERQQELLNQKIEYLVKEETNVKKSAINKTSEIKETKVRVINQFPSPEPEHTTERKAVLQISSPKNTKPLSLTQNFFPSNEKVSNVLSSNLESEKLKEEIWKAPLPYTSNVSLRRENSFKILSLNNIKTIMQNRNVRLNTGYGQRMPIQRPDEKNVKPLTSQGTRNMQLPSFPLFPKFKEEDNEKIELRNDDRLDRKFVCRYSVVQRPRTSQECIKKKVSLKDLLQYRKSNAEQN